MNTPAIKPILDYFKVARDAIDNAQRATNTEERDRIAELERDLAHARASQSEATARTIIAFCNEEVPFSVLGNSHVETAVKALSRRLDEARANLAQSAAIVETLLAELATYKVVTVGTFGGVPVVEVKPPVVEEQGPWVIMDGSRVITDMASSAPIEYHSRSAAEGDCMPDETVHTLAEARALAKVTP